MAHRSTYHAIASLPLEILVRIRSAVVTRLAMTWPEDDGQPSKLDSADTMPTRERIQEEIRELSPRDDGHRWLQRKTHW